MDSTTLDTANVPAPLGLRYLTDYYGTGEVFYLGSDGARRLAADLRGGDIPAAWGDWAGGFYGVDVDLPDGRCACLGYDGDDVEAEPGRAWGVATHDVAGDWEAEVRGGCTLAEAVAVVRALLAGEDVTPEATRRAV